MRWLPPWRTLASRLLTKSWLEEGQRLTTQSTLSTSDAPFLDDHAIEGVPYHPGVMALEMFAQASLLLHPSSCLAGFEEVCLGLPVKLIKGPMTVRVEAEVDRVDGDRLGYDADWFRIDEFQGRGLR